MNFIGEPTEDQMAIKEAVERTCSQFDDDYWHDTDVTGEWPEAFTKAMAEGGWLGVAMPERGSV